MNQLYLARKESHPEYQVLLAPFHFRLADSLATYVELNLNEMNQLKPLRFPDDLETLSDEEEEQEEAKTEEVKKEDGVDNEG